MEPCCLAPGEDVAVAAGAQKGSAVFQLLSQQGSQHLLGTEGCGVITLSQKPWLVTLIAQGNVLQVRRWKRPGFPSHAVTISHFSSQMSLLLCFLGAYVHSVTQTAPHQRKTCLQQEFNKVSKGRIFQWKEMGPNQEGRYLFLKKLYQNSRWIMMR